MRTFLKSYRPNEAPATAAGDRQNRATSSEETAPSVAQQEAPQPRPARHTGPRVLDVAPGSDLQATTSSLQRQKGIEDVTFLKKRVAELEAAFQFVDGEIRIVKDREQKLLDKILDKTLRDDFYDSDIIYAFRNIQEDIHRLANGRLYATAGSDMRPWVAERHEDHRFYTEWYQVPRKEKQLLSRSHIFDLLHEHILDSNLFGVSADVTASENKKACYRHIEKGLKMFEDILMDKRVAEDIVTDWRTTTLKCIRLGHLSDNPGSTVADTIYRRLERSTREDLSDADLKKLQQQISDLCRDAVKLHIMMRSSLEKYECLKMQAGVDATSITDRAEVYAVYNGGRGAIGREVVFTLFGALVKYPLDQGESRIVLEKAKVVVAPVTD